MKIILALIEFIAVEFVKQLLFSSGLLVDDYTFDIIYILIRSLL